MKNAIKALASIGLVVAMVIGVSKNNVKNESSAMLENIKALAFASTEQGWEPYCNCVNYFSICKYNGIESHYMVRK